jgi:beta-glucanase (GH16 family)
MKQLKVIMAIMLLFAPVGGYGQECAGGELLTQQAYQYGRFETRMQSAQGDGIVSSFFLYNVDLGCNWPAENNEIDIEMTGNRDASVQFTTHYPGPSSHTQIVPLAFNPHAGMHDYAFEWEPGVVRWFVDGSLAYTQDAPFVAGLIYPMRIMMNFYATDAPSWVGTWDPAVLPARSSYDYVRYYAYTPGSGNAGSNNNFTLEWTDAFDAPLDTDRWEVTEFGIFGNNYCTFVSNNVTTVGGELQLDMTEPLASTNSPVHFSVDATSLALSPADTVYLNGEFNGWCGSCNPMSDSDGDNIWALTLSLPAGKHEYLFTTNGWNGEVGGAPLGSSCDFSPCDQYNNYGVTIPYGVGAIETDSYCWVSCDSCGNDTDNDGITNDMDNCPGIPNGPLLLDPGDNGISQRNTDGDTEGDACDADDDNDGLDDSFELTIGTDRLILDSDGDGLSDYEEVNYDGDSGIYTPNQDTDPLNNDSDRDGFLDGMEVLSQHDPLSNTDAPTWGDINNDSIVNIADVLLASRVILDLYSLNTGQQARANVAPLVNGSPQYPPVDEINVGDLLVITRKALGLINF